MLHLNTAGIGLALRSLQSESRLLRRGDVEALAQKYIARLPEIAYGYRLFVARKGGHQFAVELELDLYESLRFLDQSGSLVGENPQDMLGIHVRWGGLGVEYWLDELGYIVEWLKTSPELGSYRYVTGFTYSELGNLAQRYGFESGAVAWASGERLAILEAFHSAYCASNGKQRHFRPVVVYLPMAEFIRRFDRT